ncbi:MAG TPA: F0F1 ATP synthase subunit A [Candidatus Saccharimonadales bacterium]
MSVFSLLAVSGPVVHIAPAGVLTIHGVVITNSMLYGWMSIVVISVALIWVARIITIKPQGGFVQFVEAGVEFITNLVHGAFDDKEVAYRYTPYFVTIFFFILFNNWLGLLPFVGEGIQSNNYPLLRPFTADLNATLSIGLVTMAMVYGASIKESGGFAKYLRHFFVGSPKNPLYFIIGLLEMFTDLTRVISLSLRLFLNVAIGEIVIGVFSYLGHVIAPLTALPFTLIELFIGALQAYIFTVLATMYLAIAVNHTNEHQREEHLTDVVDPETMGQLQPAGAK